jgi:hypothetical protein
LLVLFFVSFFLDTNFIQRSLNSRPSCFFFFSSIGHGLRSKGAMKVEAVCVWILVLYNAMAGFVCAFAPRLVEARFSRQHVESSRFFLHSIASFHFYVLVMAIFSFSLPAKSRRFMSFMGALLNLYDALSQVSVLKCFTFHFLNFLFGDSIFIGGVLFG